MQDVKLFRIENWEILKIITEWFKNVSDFYFLTIEERDLSIPLTNQTCIVAETGLFYIFDWTDWIADGSIIWREWEDWIDGTNWIDWDDWASITSWTFVWDDLVFTKDDATTVTITDAKVDLKWNPWTDWTDWISCNWKWPWVTTTVYVLQDIVEEWWSSYVCIVPHTSWTFVTDLVDLKWELCAQKWTDWTWIWDMLVSTYDPAWWAEQVAFESDLNLKQTVFTWICQEQYITENDIVIDWVSATPTLTIATIKNWETISASNPICYYTDWSGIAVRHTINTSVSVNFAYTTWVWYFYFNTSWALIATQTPWTTFDTIATVYRLYVNSTLSWADRIQVEVVEYHKNDISWIDHEWKHSLWTIHYTWLNIASNLLTSWSPNADGRNSVIALTSWTCIDDNLPYTVTSTTSWVVKFTQDLWNVTPASLNATNSAIFNIRWNDSGWILVKQTGTRYPFSFNSSTNIPEYITTLWVRTPVSNLYYFVYYVYALQDPRRWETIKIVSAETQFSTSTLASAHSWEVLQWLYPTLADTEIRPLYKLTFEYRTIYDVWAKYSALRVVDDLRKARVSRSAVASWSLPATSVTEITDWNVQTALDNLRITKQDIETATLTYAREVICRARTTANITLSWTQIIDWISLIAGDYVLVANQSTWANNWIYIVNASTWTRAPEFDSTIEADKVDIFVVEWTTYYKTWWMCYTRNPTIWTTALVFTQMPWWIWTAADQSSAWNHSHTALNFTWLASMWASIAYRYTSRTATASTWTTDNVVRFSWSTAWQIETMPDWIAVANNSWRIIHYVNNASVNWILRQFTSNTLDWSASDFTLIPWEYKTIYNIAVDTWITLDSWRKDNTIDLTVPAETYWAWWNWSNEVPTKNDVYDKIETVVSSIAWTPTWWDRITNIISLTTAEYTSATKDWATLYILTD